MLYVIGGRDSTSAATDTIERISISSLENGNVEQWEYLNNSLTIRAGYDDHIGSKAVAYGHLILITPGTVIYSNAEFL